jgi:hypothetical protein
MIDIAHVQSSEAMTAIFGLQSSFVVDCLFVQRCDLGRRRCGARRGDSGACCASRQCVCASRHAHSGSLICRCRIASVSVLGRCAWFAGRMAGVGGRDGVHWPADAHAWPAALRCRTVACRQRSSLSLCLSLSLSLSLSTLTLVHYFVCNLSSMTCNINQKVIYVLVWSRALLSQSPW